MALQPLNLGFWNIRGLNDPLKQKEVKCFVHKNKLSIVGLLEHKIKEGNAFRVINHICPQWSFVNNYTQASIGRILVCWDPQIVQIQVLDQSDQFIHCEVQSKCGNSPFFATFVYGDNFYLNRQALWSRLHLLSTASPWIVLGDFNVIRFPREKVGGSAYWPPYMDDFNNCLFALGLDDLRYTGCFLTWANKQDPTHFVSTKLDHVLVNEHWMRMYNCSNAHFPNPVISDHSPAITTILPCPRKSNKPFKFFDFLADHPQFLDIVQRVWRRVIIGNPMYRVCEKLKLLQSEFKQINRSDFSDVSARVVESRQLLDTLQQALSTQNPDPSLICQEREAYKHLLNLLRAEKSLAKQKSRIQWMKLGDQCTSYFFKSVTNTRNRSRITSLVLEDGSLTHDVEVIKSNFVNFYSNLLGTVHPGDYQGNNRIQQLVNKKLTDTQRLAMIAEVSDQETKDTFWSLNPSKAPGPDGYNAGFFKKAWPVVGREIIVAVKTFFRSGKLLRKANSTMVALVPKVPNPSKVGDFRRISCCNTVYKCIARILASRLQSALPILIDSVQSGFVKGRRIADNIFLTQELMRGYHKSSSTPRCAMKVDIKKAYDNVRWDFIWDILAAMNFHPTMIKWLQACVTTANYSLSINGEATGYIIGQKGLRQGDPLSSYLCHCDGNFNLPS